MNYDKIKRHTEKLSNLEGGINNGGLWELKKEVAPRPIDPPMAKKDEQGNVITEPETIKELYLNTYKKTQRGRDVFSHPKGKEMILNLCKTINALDKFDVDLMSRVVNWQLSKRRGGSHSVLSRSDISLTKSKAFKQKGTGRARRGANSVVQFRGGGVVHGPVLRSHSHGLPKKFQPKHREKVNQKSI